ncbi:MAG: C40 family peptidase [Geodermatophilaceae bacterium]|nr:C40 family peptidase [Geodermatophilaceae bacterium]
MATSRALRRPARALVLAAVAALGFTLAPASSHADPVAVDPPAPAAAEPTTAADAQEQVGALSHELEIVTEQYNDARIMLDRREAAASVASARLVQVQRDISELDGRVRQVAHSAYTGDQLAGFTALMTSGSPQEFLDRINTLDAISAHSNGLIADYSDAQQQALDLSAQADQALIAAEAAAADVEAKKTLIESEMPVLEALLATLTEAERQAALALAHTAAVTSTADDGSDERADQPERADRSEREAPSAPPSSVVAPSQAAQIAVDTALAQLGDPYLWAAAGPDSFDCSGLTMYAYAAAGINLPHSSRMQSTTGMTVSRDQLLPGDLLFYYSPVSHVGMYIGDGQIVHAPNTGSVVSIQDAFASGWDYSHAQRIALP